MSSGTPGEPDINDLFSNVPDFSKKVSDPFSSQVNLPPQ